MQDKEPPSQAVRQNIKGEGNVTTGTGDIYYSSTPTPKGKEAWKVPHNRNSSFTGREPLLEELANNLAKGETTALTQAIYGLGGVGKTQIALEYTHKYQDNYKVVWWVNSETELTLLTDYASLALVLGLTNTTEIEQQKEFTKN